jgi:hypothetical protein
MFLVKKIYLDTPQALVSGKKNNLDKYLPETSASVVSPLAWK